MKWLLFLICPLLTVHPSLHAQVANRINYQAVIRQSSGELLISKSIGMRISMLQGTITGSAVYVETHKPTTSPQGVVTIELGGGTAVTGNFQSIDWSKGPYFIKTETDPAGGTNYTIVGTTQLLNVPFAMFARSASLSYSQQGDTLFSGNQYVIVPGLSSANQSAQGLNFPTLTTTPATAVVENTAVVGGSISSQGGSAVTTRGICWATTASPTTSNFTVTSGAGIGNFQATLSGLFSGVTYYARAFAINGQGTSYGNQVSFITTGPLVGDCSGKIKDIDGNEYNVVQIGKQCWMKENLRVTRFRNGDSIPLDASGGFSGDSAKQTWSFLGTPARTIYNHLQANLLTYGYLYNAGVIRDNRGVCPVGWHLGNEWGELALAYGGELVAGGKMKSAGTSLWRSPNEGADNLSGFTALPGGYRGYNGTFMSKGEVAIYWATTSGADVNGIIKELHYDSRVLLPRTSVGYGGHEPHGFSVRCVRD